MSELSLRTAQRASGNDATLSTTTFASTDALSAVPDREARVRGASARLLAVARRAQPVLSIVALVLLWQLLVTVLHPNALAIVGPAAVYREAVQMWHAGTLQTDLKVSGEEFGIGFAIALGVGIVVGLVLGTVRWLGKVFDPWVTVFYTVPVIAVAPMIIIALGITLESKVIIVATAALFPVLINTETGVRQVERSLQDVARAFRASRLETLRYVVLPGAIPYVLAGVRLAVGRGLISLVAGDLFGATSGLGYLILSGAQNLNTAGVYVGVVVLSVIGLVLTRLVGLLERRFASFRAGSDSR